MTTHDVSNLSATETRELMASCVQRLEVLQQQLKEQAELLGLKCTDLNGKKPRRKSKQHHED